jgi:hypothetical protein
VEAEISFGVGERSVRAKTVSDSVLTKANPVLALFARKREGKDVISSRDIHAGKPLQSQVRGDLSPGVAPRGSAARRV